MKRLPLLVLCLLLSAAALPSAKTLDMWVIDTEGGKALLVVSPSGQSMLIDTGYPGNAGRDTARILEACRAAGVKKLDVLLTTHYDVDHVSNTPSLVASMPVGLFVDHGARVVDDPGTVAAVKAYDELWAGRMGAPPVGDPPPVGGASPVGRSGPPTHLVARPGDRIPFAGVDVLVVTSAGRALKTPLPGAGQPNPACAGVERRTWSKTDEDHSENSASVGTLLTFGTFRMLDLGDLTWNREVDLVCPDNPIGVVDLFMVTHHGNDISNTPALVNAIRPRVAVMNNGARKIGAASVIRLLKTAPRMRALYLLHWSANAPDDNPPDDFIANLQDSPDGKWIKISAQENGTMVVTNGRTGVAKTYTR
jgi:competence protein ComEC